MAYIFLGFMAFLLFMIYDINSAILNKKLLHKFFFLGCFLLITATSGIIITSLDQIKLDLVKMSIFGIFALISFFLLIYTLFFALPFQDTYVKTNNSPKTYQEGVYALCRHPGLLWFIGFYLFLWLTLRIPLLLMAGAIFSCCNLLYVIFQDRWTFTRIFEDYHEYKKTTPFIIPNFKSIKRCLQTLQ